MSLLRNESIQEVAVRLAFSSKGLDNILLAARSSLSNARQRLGSAPVKTLFEKSADHWASQTHASLYTVLSKKQETLSGSLADIIQTLNNREISSEDLIKLILNVLKILIRMGQNYNLF